MRRTSWTVIALGAALSLSAVAGGATDSRLSGVVGPGFTISLRDSQGNPVSRLDAGPVELTVDDRSDEHNFHLRGPGVDVTTGVEEIGVRTFSVTLRNGAYTFVCDPHAADMRGSFDVGAVPPPPTTPVPTPRLAPSAKVGARLALTVGPGFTISLKTLAGKRVTVLRPGAYTVVARDRSAIHNARLRGAGVSRTTGIGFVGTKTWRVALRNGTLTILCDPHATRMRATVRVL